MPTTLPNGFHVHWEDKDSMTVPELECKITLPDKSIRYIIHHQRQSVYPAINSSFAVGRSWYTYAGKEFTTFIEVINFIHQEYIEGTTTDVSNPLH